MIVEVKIEYDEFLKFKAWAYDRKRIKNYTADKLKIDCKKIESIDFNYKRTYRAFLDGDLVQLQNDFRRENYKEKEVKKVSEKEVLFTI